MPHHAIQLLLLFAVLWPPTQSSAPEKQQNAEGPTSEKAQKTYEEALDYSRQHNLLAALDTFRKADKQDNGHCLACKTQVMKCAVEMGDWKAAEKAASEIVAGRQGNKEVALAYYDFGWVLMREGIAKRKKDAFARAHDEFSNALASFANFPDAVFSDGEALARCNKDDAAKAQFEHFLKIVRPDDPKRQRALRFLSEPEQARARMAPVFSVTTLDGRQVSLDDLHGKVVLLDFWATWCVPCRAALPHIRELAKKFEGQPFIILSISLDSDEDRWKDFVAKNGMTWLNYRDGRFTGHICRLFDVNAIPHTFTIDADGVLQEEHVGDASLEAKIKKLIAKARAAQPASPPAGP